MQEPRALTIGRMCRLWRCVAAQVIRFSVFHNGGAPKIRLFAKVNAFVAGRIIESTLSVGGILSRCRFAKIAQFVVTGITVYVVDMSDGPRAGRNRPHNAMGIQTPPVHRNNNMACGLLGARDCPEFHSGAMLSPAEKAGFGIVGKEFSHQGDGYTLIDLCRRLVSHMPGFLAGCFSRKVKRPLGVGALSGLASIAVADA